MLLSIRNISKGYGEPGSNSYRPVLNQLNLDIAEGEKIAVVGPSGCGKTTLLNLIGTLDLPDSGNILFDGKDITQYGKKELSSFRNRYLGFIFQLHHLLPHLTLRENVILPFIANGKNIRKEQYEWADYLIQKVGVWEQRNQKPSELSGGEAQRAAVIRALVNKPRILLADEPTGALDEENARSLAALLINLSDQEKVTLIMVTHSTELAEQMDKKYGLKNGILTESTSIRSY